MKFGKTFECHLTPEWRQQYMRYTELKVMILNAANSAPDATVASSSAIFHYYDGFDRTFFTICHQELSRVSDFFTQKLAEGRRKLFDLDQMLTEKKQKSRQMGLVCSEFYLSLIMLQNFQSLNILAFRKITKKYDKYMKSVNGKRWFSDYILNAPFTDESTLRNMITEVERLYTVHLTNGNRTKAMDKLRVPPLRKSMPPARVFMAGLWLGLFIIAAAVVVISVFFMRSDVQLMTAVSNLYRGPIIWSICSFFLALNVYIWQNNGINHVLIFEINLRRQIQPVIFLEMSSLLGYIYALSMIVFIHHKEFNIDNPIHIPLVSFLIPIALLLNPIRIMNFSARMWVLRCLGRVMAAPIYHISFADFWVAEQLTSIVIFLVDCYLTIRFYVRLYGYGNNSLDFEPDFMVYVIFCLPAWFRLLQSGRRICDSKMKDPVYILNAIKYALSILVVILFSIVIKTSEHYTKIFENPLVWVYLLVSFLSAVYFAVWDVYRDFALFRIWQCNSNIFLRQNLIYRKWFYYFAIVTNTLFRFIWVLEIYLVCNGYMLPYTCKTLTGVCEIIRRTIWNCLRLENEHLFNCGRFRAVRELYLTPFDRDGRHSDKKDF